LKTAWRENKKKNSHKEVSGDKLLKIRPFKKKTTIKKVFEKAN